MKQRSTEQTFIRMLIAENIKAKRFNAKRIRDYALYDLQERTIGSICDNTEYLKILIKNVDELDLEYSLLLNIYLYKIKRN